MRALYAFVRARKPALQRAQARFARCEKIFRR
jgi:hypothetical protein